MTDRIKAMVEGVLKKTIYPETKYARYDRADYLLSDRMRQTKRVCDYILAQDVVVPEGALMAGLIKFEKCPYPSDFANKDGLVYTCELLDTFFVPETPFEDFKFWSWQHATGDFGKIIEIGIEGLKEQIKASMKNHSDDADKTEFLQACLMMCDGIIAWEDKCAQKCAQLAGEEKDPNRRQELLKMEENLKRVPRYPARNFYEAMQGLYFCFDFMADSLGLPDRWLYKYYKQDIEAGVISEAFAKELLQELFIRIQSWTPLESDNFTKGGQCNFSLGGYDVNGEDSYNELSELILTSLLELPLYIPEVTFRWTKKTPFELFYHIMDLARKDPNQRIAFVGDDVKIECLMRNCSVSWEEAVNYVTVGCNLIALSGGMWYGGGCSNQVKPLRETLYRRKEDVLKAKTFADFFEIYKEELEKALLRDIEVSNCFVAYAAKDECVLGSLFLNGCIEQGVSLTKGGAIGFSELGGGTGLMCTIDSLAILKQFVYDEKIVTMQEMLQALENNWEGYEDLRTVILKKGKFFGNDYEATDALARRITTCINEFVKDKTDMFGKHFLGVIAPGYREYHKWFGAVTGATPDGRYKGEPFKTIGAGQTEGRDREGLTALLNSVATYDPTRHFAGITVTNVNLDSESIYNDDNFKKTVQMIETYFRNGGAQIQLNAVSREELLSAKENPEKYKNLRVRVSGFSEYFVRLSEVIQDNVIERTQHK